MDSPPSGDAPPEFGGRHLAYGGAGGHAEAPTCPEGTVAIGTTQRADNGVVGYVGLLCADRDTVAAGKSPKSGDITFVGPEGNNLPARSVSYARFAQAFPPTWSPSGAPSGAPFTA